jgi:putative nucleotidyltransferase with HDIG domain
MIPRSATAYFQVLTVAAVTLLALSAPLAGGLNAELLANAAGILWCIIIGLVAEAMAVDFKIGLPGYPARSSLAFLPFLCALTLFSVPVAAGVIAFVLLVSQFVFRRISFWKASFNISQGVISGFVAGSAFHIVAGEGVNLFNFNFYLGFVSLAVSFFLTNMLLSSVALALLKQSQLLNVFRQVVGAGGANLWYDLLASPIALVPVVLYRDSAVTGMTVILLPLLLFQYSYISNQKVIQRSKDLLRALVKAIETRDPYTSGHSLRVATLAKAIGEDLGLSVRMLNHVEMAALLHDIGKIHPEFTIVLSKPFELSKEERALIETHAARGADLLRDMRSVPDIVIDSVRHHHERYDGAGYPDNIAGAAIPLPARIIMLCDSIDAMLSDRPYRNALTLDAVRQELLRCAGTQFDPEIVEVVLARNTLERAVLLVAADVGSDTWAHVMWA